MKVDKKAVGKKIKEYRLKKGLTQKRFGALFGASNVSVHKWEKGINYPETDTIIALSNFIGISVAELLATQPEETRSGYISSNWQPTEDYINWVMGA